MKKKDSHCLEMVVGTGIEPVSRGRSFRPTRVDQLTLSYETSCCYQTLLDDLQLYLYKPGGTDFVHENKFGVIFCPRRPSIKRRLFYVDFTETKNQTDKRHTTAQILKIQSPQKKFVKTQSDRTSRRCQTSRPICTRGAGEAIAKELFRHVAR